ncbi:hypothetical protein AGMMS50249_0280 [candidate division SR1 bacterium]|nr:hypothetical protein AGMMS50249_0280 [candidate division SR1 bacterium]
MKKKILIIIGAIVVLGAMTFLVWRQYHFTLEKVVLLVNEEKPMIEEPMIEKILSEEEVQQSVSEVKIQTGENKVIIEGLTGNLAEMEQKDSLDSEKILGIETRESCEFGCDLSFYRDYGDGRDSAEIHQFTSPGLGISFNYISKTFLGGHTGTNKIVHSGNLICLDWEDTSTKLGCIEFISYVERENIAKTWYPLERYAYEAFGTGKTFGTGDLFLYSMGESGYDIAATRHHIPNTDLYFLSYQCEGCAPGYDFRWIKSI